MIVNLGWRNELWKLFNKKKYEGKNVYNYIFVKFIYMIISNCNLGLFFKIKVYV